ncbi:hypothetical protein J437_LFUL010680 [Ladona fulva]|uniref:DNA topoisomerase n=1 Tax=Ladona fulva TaxID=123851 RepID=A0A8K0P217_LADFU|nr:hypothetical protein J437_LFUL010680 [Ladona fulva]
MRVLNVAEKNDAAKNLAGIISGGNLRRREGLSIYNKIYEFDYNLFGQRCTMVMTSVSGHLLNYEFTGPYRKWNSCNPLVLFDAPVVKACPEGSTPLKQTLQREARTCDVLIIWTDCDREGENIGFEVINVCLEVKPRMRVYRAKFSEITGPSVHRAINNLTEPDRRVSNAVDVRQELDLRIGVYRLISVSLLQICAAFTRFQTLRLKAVFPATLGESLISYGSCQFPTLGFVVERYKAIQDFIPEPFWKIKVNHTQNGLSVDFNWKRVRLMDQQICKMLFELCEENPIATVEKVQKTMKIAEKLYVQGYISYPRTETNIFPKELNLRQLVEKQVEDPAWGGKEKQIYEFVVRHFLACCSKDAEGMETLVEIDIANEKVKNYLDVYPYKKWEGREIHNYTLGQTFEPTSLDMVESETKAPDLLTEADLIALMEKHGIGTDATHAEHIETIKNREYVGLRNNIHFMPSHLGMGLVEGYDSMGYPMSKPNLRAELENDLKCICEGTKDPAAVLAEQVSKYREVFQRALEQARKIDEALGKYFNEQRRNAEENIGNNQNDGMLGLPQNSLAEVFPCNKCGAPMILKQRTGNSTGYYISCSRFPECRNAIWLPSNILHVEVAQETCQQCGPQVHMLQFKFKPRSAMPFYPDDYIGCVGGCDHNLLDCLQITSSLAGNAPSQNISSQRSSSVSSVPNQTRDSGYQSNNSSRRMSLDIPNSQSFGGNSVNARGNLREPSDEASSVLCHCGQNALKLTVRKVGPNTGRQFYKCQENQCDFFLWASDNEDGSADREPAAENWDGRGAGGGGRGGGTSWGGGGSGRGGTSWGRGNDTRWGGGGGAVMSVNTPASSMNFSQQNQVSADVNCNCGEPARRSG